MIALISPQWLHEHFDDGLIILDASPESTVSGKTSPLSKLQIPGARSFDLKNDFSKADAPFPNTMPSAEEFQEGCRKLGIVKNAKIVVYDNLGIYTSPRVWWMFKAMGHQNIGVLDGGLPGWVERGYQTAPKTALSYPAGDFEATLNPELLKRFEDVERNISSREFTVIDARTEGRFNGTEPEPRPELASGSIPGSQNIPFQTVLEGINLKSPQELTSVFDTIAERDKPVVFSCGSGLTACILALAYTQVSGEIPAVYDGSWTEWVQRYADRSIGD